MDEYPNKPIQLSPSQALLKAQQYCAYQERCQQEVRDKLYSWGLTSSEVENLLCQLIENHFVNEERFAKSFAGGKFRIKKWGKQKIKSQLKLRKISEYCIRVALKEIPDEDYLHCLEQLCQKKWTQSREKHLAIKKQKIFEYLYRMGYESDLIQDVFKTLGLPEERDN